jgi:predicted Zn-ribbon and HTH transcriptional regulator
MVNPYKYVVREDNGKNDVEHRVIMEQHLGRKLMYNEVVHHKDGNHKNNVISNLELISRSNHGRHHAKPNYMIGVRCSYCGKITFKQRSHYLSQCKNGITDFFCNKSCSAKTKSPPQLKPRKTYGENNLFLPEFVLQEYKKGKSAMDIVREFGIPKENVYYAMKVNNLARGTPTSERYPDLKKIIERELKKNLTGAEIAKKYNIPKTTIYRNIEELKRVAP